MNQTGETRHRLLIADDQDFARQGLAALLLPHFEVVATARDAVETVALAERHLPDVALIDVQMPGGGGLHATREIRRRLPGVAIVALSADESDHMVLDLLTSGATSYILKTSTSGAELVAALNASIAAHARFP